MPPPKVNVTGAQLLEMDTPEFVKFVKQSCDDDGCLTIDGDWTDLSAKQLGLLGKRMM